LARTFSTRLLAMMALILMAGCTSIERLALPEASLGDAYWSRHDTASNAVIDHQPWQTFLDSYVATDAAGVNRVDYGAVSADDRATLERYLDTLQGVPIHQYRRDEQLAFWVNLYNAKTVAIVLDHYPVDSIRDIKLGEGLIVVGPWGAPTLRVSGRPLSLNDIEHAIIRPVWQDQRIHYVLNCAAAGCPNLGLKAYGGDSIDAAMTAAAKTYVNDPRGVHIEADDKLRLSKIYAWFREDFGPDQRAVLDAIGQYAASPLQAELASRQRIDRFAYDWSLNDAKNAATNEDAPLTARRSPSLDEPVAPPNASPASALSIASAASPKAPAH